MNEKFEVGKTYAARCPFDGGTITGKVLKRTATTITTELGYCDAMWHVVTLRINKPLSAFFGCEVVKPWGNRHFLPNLYANEFVS